MVAAVREVAPTVPIGCFVMIAVGTGPEVDTVRAAMGDGLYAEFAGEPGRVAEHLHTLAELGIDRVQLTDLVPDSWARLAPALLA